MSYQNFVLKKQHERGAVEDFLREYNRIKNASFSVKEVAENKDLPDVLVEDNAGNRLWIEVTTAYYCEEHAKITWDVVRGKATMAGMIGGGFDQALLRSINELICEKSEKRYNVSEAVLLLIAGCPPLTLKRDVDVILPEICVPEDNPFCEIWLGLGLPESISCPGGYYVFRLS